MCGGGVRWLSVGCVACRGAAAVRPGAGWAGRSGRPWLRADPPLPSGQATPDGRHLVFLALSIALASDSISGAAPV